MVMVILMCVNGYADTYDDGGVDMILDIYIYIYIHIYIWGC